MTWKSSPKEVSIAKRRATRQEVVKAVNMARPIAKAQKLLARKLVHLYEKALELAEGVYVEETLPGGVRRTYQRAPDGKMITYLIDRAQGKPTEHKELTGEVNIVFNLGTNQNLLGLNAKNQQPQKDLNTEVIDAEATMLEDLSDEFGSSVPTSLDLDDGETDEEEEEEEEYVDPDLDSDGANPSYVQPLTPPSTGRRAKHPNKGGDRRSKPDNNGTSTITELTLKQNQNGKEKSSSSIPRITSGAK